MPHEGSPCCMSTFCSHAGRHCIVRHCIRRHCIRRHCVFIMCGNHCLADMHTLTTHAHVYYTAAVPTSNKIKGSQWIAMSPPPSQSL